MPFGLLFQEEKMIVYVGHLAPQCQVTPCRVTPSQHLTSINCMNIDYVQLLLCFII